MYKLYRLRDQPARQSRCGGSSSVPGERLYVAASPMIPQVDICRCGGIGRHRRLKISRRQRRTGSSPVSGTKHKDPNREQQAGLPGARFGSLLYSDRLITAALPCPAARKRFTGFDISLIPERIFVKIHRNIILSGAEIDTIYTEIECMCSGRLKPGMEGVENVAENGIISLAGNSKAGDADNESGAGCSYRDRAVRLRPGNCPDER
jgi:hypothetical protein